MAKRYWDILLSGLAACRPRQLARAACGAVLALGAGAALAATDGSATDALRSIEVVGTRFRVTTESGKVLPQTELIGAVLSYADAAGRPVPIRIDRVSPDPKDKGSEMLLYGFSVQDTGGEWRELCDADPDGIHAGFPVQVGLGKDFILTCTSGAQGKCVRFGYKPWATGPHGEDLLPYWRACTRMVRADYCGDGVPHTKNGTLIDMFDKIGIQKDEPFEGTEFEAAWSPEGAVCVRHVRIPEIYSLDALRAACPRLKPGDIGEHCSEENMTKMSPVLLMNKSRQH